MKAVIFHREAEEELQAAVLFYEERRDGLGAELTAEVERAVAQISQRPRSCPAHGTEGYRKCHLDRFPFTIFFVEQDQHIWIAAVAHQKRRPGYWMSRRPESEDDGA